MNSLKLTFITQISHHALNPLKAGISVQRIFISMKKQKEGQLGTLILSYLIKQSLNCPIFPFQQQLRDLVDS